MFKKIVKLIKSDKPIKKYNYKLVRHTGKTVINLVLMEENTFTLIFNFNWLDKKKYNYTLEGIYKLDDNHCRLELTRMKNNIENVSTFLDGNIYFEVIDFKFKQVPFIEEEGFLNDKYSTFNSIILTNNNFDYEYIQKCDDNLLFIIKHIHLKKLVI